MPEELSIAVIGAGLGGLAAAISTVSAKRFKVTVFETAAQLTEVGAGVQITSQTINVFRAWGIADELEKAAAVAKACIAHRYSDGKILAHEPDWAGWMTEEFGAPVWDLHRGDMQLAMYKKAKELGVEFRFGAQVASVDCAAPSITLKSGETLSFDFIIGADGLHGMSRACLLGRADPPLPTGDLAYRIVLNADQLADEPELLDFMSKDIACHFWLGPHAHVVSYSLKAGKQLNIVLLVPDDLPAHVARQKGDTAEMLALFEGWDPLLKRFLAKVQNVDKWRLMHHPGLEQWHHKDGKFVMIGDAVHPMLPYLAQGANSAVMDGAVIGEALKRCKSAADLPTAVQAYLDIIKPRSAQIVAGTHQQRLWNHATDDSDVRKERDAIFAAQPTRASRKADFPFYWINPSFWKFVCGFDPYRAIEEHFKRSM